MIKSSVVTPDTPSILSGERGKTHMVKMGRTGAEPVSVGEEAEAAKLSKKIEEATDVE